MRCLGRTHRLEVRTGGSRRSSGEGPDSKHDCTLKRQGELMQGSFSSVQQRPMQSSGGFQAESVNPQQ